MSMPKNVEQLRSLIGGIGYYRKFMANKSTRLRPINALLKQGVKFVFTPAMEAIISSSTKSPSRLSRSTQTGMPSPTPPALYAWIVTPAAMASAPLSSKNNRTVPSLIVFITGATLDNERSWTPLDPDAGIVWAIKRLRGHLWSIKFRIYSDPKALDNIAKIVERNARVRR